MSNMLIDKSFLETVQFNCDISDARDHGVYSMCTMVLKLRNLYKWEKNLEPWEEPEPAYLLDWIDGKENYWAKLRDTSLQPLGLPGISNEKISPFDHEKINPEIAADKLYYGAGYGRSMKSIFFLAEEMEQYTIEKCPVIILGKERAKEMASPFAMAQDGIIVIRSEPLRFFLWDQMQELRNSCRSSVQHFLKSYGLQKEGSLNQELFKTKLDTMIDDEMNLFIYHEVGEILQETFDSATLRTIVGRFPSSLIEFVCRAIKDILADTHPKGLLAHLIHEKRDSSLGLYIALLDGMREKLFPEIFTAWQSFLETKDWQKIEQARSTCLKRHQKFAEAISDITSRIGDRTDDQIISLFNRKVLAPIGIEQPV